MALVPLLRSFRGSDIDRARAAETALLTGERSRRQTIQRELERALCSDDEALPTLGESLGSGRPVRLPLAKLLGHTLVVGPSGAGKTYFVVGLLQALWQLGVPRTLFLDPKAEGVELALRALVRQARRLPEAQREAFLDRVVWIDLFSGSALPCLQVLSDDGGDAELLTAEVASILMGELTATVGIHQEGHVHRLLEVLHHAKLPLTAFVPLMQNPDLFDALAGSGVAPELCRAAGARLRSESRERLAGIASRIESILRLKSTRLALGGATSCMDFGQLLDGSITLVNLAPPGGADDISRVLRGLIWSKVSRAIRARPNGAAPVAVCIDEFTTFLSAGGARAAAGIEDGLRLARSKGAYHILMAQDFSASITKISASLPTVLKINSHLSVVFRAARSDDWTDYLPVTGCRPRPRGPYWEAPRPGYLDRAEERELLRAQLVRAPDRTALMVDSRVGKGIFIRTANLDLDVEEREVEALRTRASRNRFVRPVAELERGEADVRARLDALAAGVRSPDTASRPGAAKSRGPRPFGMG